MRLSKSNVPLPAASYPFAPDKEKSTDKIDGVVATANRPDQGHYRGNGTSESVYDSRGLLFI